MAYRFSIAESFAEGFERMARGQLRRIKGQLADAVDTDIAIHQSRRALKRLRSLLAVARPALGEEAFRADDGRVREIGRLLAGARDAKVLMDTLARLRSASGGEAESAGFRRLADEIARHHRARKDETMAIPPGVHELVGEAKSRAKSYGRLDIGIADIAAGMARTYKAGRKAMRRACGTGEGEAFHDWRKHVQRHWRHMLLLEEAWEGELAARARSARELARLLGEDHDLLMLSEAVTGPFAEAAGRRTVASVASLAGEQQLVLRAVAAPIGQRLYAEKHNALGKRMACYWETARELARQGATGDAAAGYEAVLQEEHAEQG